MKRRNFLKDTPLAGVGLTLAATLAACENKEDNQTQEASATAAGDTPIGPIAIATWDVVASVAKAGEELAAGNKALDAAIAGAAIEEANVKNTTVGKGGAPDRDGHVTLDACVMDSNGNCGAVVAVENITHVAALARKVMEETPHVMLAGQGAEQFAYEQGFPKENLLTEESRKAWENWKIKSEYKPIINIENHDTIGMLCLDAEGDIAGVCTTSGAAYKMRGRVGDSPIIGSGLFVDNEVGAAVATGLGEEVVKTVGSFLIVELMRNGKTPQEACEEAIRRIVAKGDRYKDFQVGYVAINKAGKTGAYSIHKGFSYTIYDGEVNNIPADYYDK